MSAKDQKSEVFSCIKKVKCEFLARSHTDSFKKRLLNTSTCHFLKQMCACQKKHIRVDCVFCALCMVCPGSAVSWNRQDCSGQSMKRVQSTWSVGNGLCWNARTQM